MVGPLDLDVRGAVPHIVACSFTQGASILNKGNLEVIDELRTDDVEGVYNRVTNFRTAFPDLHVTIETQVAEDDWAVMRLIYRGTHLGPFMGVPPTSRQVAFATIVMNRYSDGKSVENWGIHDYHGLLEQLKA